MGGVSGWARLNIEDNLYGQCADTAVKLYQII